MIQDKSHKCQVGVGAIPRQRSHKDLYASESNVIPQLPSTFQHSHPTSRPARHYNRSGGMVRYSRGRCQPCPIRSGGSGAHGPS